MSRNIRRTVSRDRYKESFDSKDKGGSNGKRILDFSKSDSKPDFYTPVEGVNKINILPYEIKTKKHPRVATGRAKVGDFDYNLDIYVHPYIGPNSQDTIICPKKTYNKSCPICDESKRFYDAGKKDEGKALLPKRKCIYNVQPLVKGESKPVQVFEVSQYLFEKELIEEANACEEGNDVIDFADTSEEGKTVKFRGSKTKFGQHEYLEYKNFDFVDRESEIDSDVLDQVVSLDEALVVLSFEEIEKIFFAEPSDEEEDEEDEKPSKKKSKHRDEEEEDEEEDEKPAPKKKKPSREEEEEEEEPAPKKKAKPKDDDEEEDEEPAPKKSSSGKCPHGHRFGKDTDEFPECDKCDKKIWKACSGM